MVPLALINLSKRIESNWDLTVVKVERSLSPNKIADTNWLVRSASLLTGQTMSAELLISQAATCSSHDTPSLIFCELYVQLLMPLRLKSPTKVLPSNHDDRYFPIFEYVYSA
jgi:hypothetical protein